METGTVRSLNGPTEAKFGKKYGLNIDGQWYDFFTKYPLPAGVAVGATVEYFAEPGSGTFNAKIKKIKATGFASGPRESVVSTPMAPGKVADREVAIMRQNAVTNANKFFENNKKEYDLQQLLETAEILTAYYKGEIDATSFNVEVNEDTDIIVEHIKKAAGTSGA